MPMYLNMQRQYARRNVKENLNAKGNNKPQKQRVNENEQEEQFHFVLYWDEDCMKSYTGASLL